MFSQVSVPLVPVKGLDPMYMSLNNQTIQQIMHVLPITASLTCKYPQDPLLDLYCRILYSPLCKIYSRQTACLLNKYNNVFIIQLEFKHNVIINTSRINYT